MDLKEKRKHKNLTQQGLAEIVGVSYVTISKLESGYQFPHDTNRKKIEEALGDVEWIKTRLNGVIHSTKIRDNETDEDLVIKSIVKYVKSTKVKNRIKRVNFLIDFLRYYKKRIDN